MEEYTIIGEDSFFEDDDNVNKENNDNETLNEYIKMDWDLVTSEERVKKVEEIIANTPPEKLTSNYLERMADYLVFPLNKEERKQKKILTKNRLNATVNKRETSYEGLISKLENGEDGLYNMISDNRNQLLDPPKQKITQEDLDTIPGLRELQDAIEKTDADFKLATGKRKYLLKQQIIQMYQDQYILKKAFNQPMYSKNLTKTLAKLNLDEKVYMDAEGNVCSTGIINLFNPAHIVAILCNYSGLKMETWDKFDSDIYYLLLDFENLVDKALEKDYPLLYKLLIYKIDGKTNVEIQELLEAEFGIKHSVEYISSLWRNKIPKIIAETASRDWLDWHYTFEERGHWKRCGKCGQIKLAHNKFFSKNSASKDGWYSICKDCRNAKTKEKKMR
jgi:hypothetical protein